MKAVHLFLTIIFFTSVLPAQSTASISGRVTFDGTPVMADVQLIKDDKVIASTKTDAAGAYLFENIVAGDYKVRAMFNFNGASHVQEQDATVADVLVTVVDIACPTPMDQETLHKLLIKETVTISADSPQRVEEISKTVSVIEGQEMRDRADITMVDSLRTIPGFRIQQLGGFGRTASIKTRGLRNQDTAVLIDGVRLRDSASITGDATAFLSDLTLTSVSKVEVLRGPGSSLYGTNAVGGTIDFQTPVPPSGWHGQLSGAFGGLGLGRFRGNLSKGTSDNKFGFNAALSRTVFTKGIDGDDDARNTNFQSRVEFNPFSKTNISARFFLSNAFVALNSNPDTVFGAVPPPPSTIIDADEGVNFSFDANDPDNSQKSRFFNGQAVLSQAISSVLSFQGYYSGLTTRRRNDNGPLGIPFQFESTSVFEGAIHTANGQIDWTPNGRHRVTAGYEFEHENFYNEGFTPSGTEDFFTRASQSSNTVFVQDLIRLFDGRLQLAAGFRAQFFSLKTPGFSLTNPPYSDLALENPPSAYTFDGSASYYFARTGTKLRTHVGNGYRVPSLFERFGSFFNSFAFPNPRFEALGDPDLKPEKTAAFDVGVDQYLFRRKLSLSGQFFYTRSIDLIGFGNRVRNIGSTTRLFGGYENQKGGVARGFEFSGDFKPTSSTTVFASYTYTNSDQIAPQVFGSGVFRTLGVPNHQFTFNATQRVRRFWVNADFVGTSSYLDPIFSNATFNTYIYRFKGNRRLDLTAGYTVSMNRDKLSLRIFGTVENLFDHEYFENGFRITGRTGRAGVSFAF